MTLDVRPIAGALGAEILGLDLSAPLGAATVDAIREALHRHLVIFFPRQTLTPAEHLAFARLFGEPEGKHPFIPHIEGFDEVAVISAKEGGRADLWHTDVTFAEQPPLGSILHVQECPEYGGDTLWANAHLAYEMLSPSLQRFLEGLTAVHAISAVARIPKDVPSARHPVIRTHPKTGRKSLFVNPTWTFRIAELAYRESEILLDFLFEHATLPEFTCRRRWSRGDLAFWDNRCTMHYALADFGDAPRRIHRVTLRGEKPF
jgi:taurine dioxygenase